MLDEMFGGPKPGGVPQPKRVTADQASPWAGKLLVVTGGAGAIGSEVCRYALEKHLMVVAVVDLHAAQVDRVVNKLKQDHAGSQVHGFVSDVSKLEGQQQLVRRIEDKTGMVPHIVFLCAGINRSAPLLQATPATMRATMGANFWGIYNGVMAFLPTMERAEGGCKRKDGWTPVPRTRHIISVASMAGVCQCMGTYGVSKHAVVCMSESFELELTQRGSPVSMGCMVPGWIKTADPYSLGNMPAQRVAEEMFDGIRKGRFLMTTHPDLLPVSLRGRLDYLIPHHPASAALGNPTIDAALNEPAAPKSHEGWNYEHSCERPSDVLHVALADTAKGFSSEILGSFATEYVDNQRLLARISSAKEAAASAAAKPQPPSSHFELTGRDAAGEVVPADSVLTHAQTDLKGKVAVITGASRGMGHSLALALSALGCAVHLISRTQSKLTEVATSCRAAGASQVCCSRAVVATSTVLVFVRLSVELTDGWLLTRRSFTLAT